jgi:hypothetical protein
MEFGDIRDFLRSHIEFIVIFVISILTLIVSYYQIDYLSSIFLNKELNLNSQICSIFSTILGLILTTYAIFFGLIPIFAKSFKKTDAYKKINFRFYIATIASLIVLILSIVTNFIGDNIIKIIIPFQMALCTFVIFIFVLLTTYIYIIFKNGLIK